jgi:hypothetical protein
VAVAAGVAVNAGVSVGAKVAVAAGVSVGVEVAVAVGISVGAGLLVAVGTPVGTEVLVAGAAVGVGAPGPQAANRREPISMRLNSLNRGEFINPPFDLDRVAILLYSIYFKRSIFFY